jgi:hypothetical protein
MFRSKKSAQKKIDSLICDAFAISEIELQKNKLKQVLKEDLYNRAIEIELLNQEYPGQNVDVLMATSTLKKKVVLSIRDNILRSIAWIKEDEIIERIEVQEDPDIKRLTLKTIQKNKNAVKIVEISENRLSCF